MDDGPMRDCTVERNPMSILDARKHNIRGYVTLDGDLFNDVVRCDPDAGWLEHYVTVGGKLLIQNDEITVMRVYGNVRFYGDARLIPGKN